MVIIYNFKSYYRVYKEPVDVIDAMKFNTTEGFDVNKLFNQEVDLSDYEIAYVSNDELKKIHSDLDVGTYEIVIQDKNRNLRYESLVTIVDNSGPEIKLKEQRAFNGSDYLELATFLESCHDNVSSECEYHLYDEEGNIITSFSKTEGEHTFILEAVDENGNASRETITYTIDNTLPIQTPYGVYYSAAGFTSDNPIAKQALSYVGLRGYNCEQLFNLALFNTPGIKENIVTYKDRQRFKDEHRYEVPLIEAMPGDELRYASNGLGQSHVAIYIGNGMAVHGGFNYTDVVVFNAIVPIASIPRVYRYKY